MVQEVIRMNKSQRGKKMKQVKRLEEECIALKVEMEAMQATYDEKSRELRGKQADLTVLKQQLQAP